MNQTPEQEEVETTGHTWDEDLKEYNNPLPRWWLWTFYITCLWGLLYTIAYPAWPLINEATPGFLGFSTRANVQADIDAVTERNSGLYDQLASADLTSLPENAELYGFAVNGGAAIFRSHCSQCHGSGAAGAAGYPNLLDDDWLWGGSVEDIAYTVTHGIRNDQSPDAHWSQMPAYGDILSEEEIAQVVHHLLSISGQEHDAELAGAGSQVFLDQCSGCHMEDGTGDRAQGAPNLADAIWLYGGDEATLTETITNARFGVMPAWSVEYRPAQGLTIAEINAVATYVHQLGGGE